MGAFVDSLPKDTAGTGQAPYAQAILDAVQAGRHDPIEWSYVTLGRVKLAVFARPMTFEGVYLAAGAGLLQQIADVLGCSLLTPKIQDGMYTQAGTRILPWLDYDKNRMMTIAWFQRSTNGISELLRKAGYAGGLAMGIGKPWQLDNDLLLYPGRSENFGLYVPASLCHGGVYGGVKTEATVSLPSTQVRVLQGRGWAHTLGQSDYSELISLVNRNCLVQQDDGSWKLTDLAIVLQDPILSAFVSHNGPLKILRQPGVPIAVRRGTVGGIPQDGRDGKSAAPFQLTAIPAEGKAAPAVPLPPAVSPKFLEPDYSGYYAAAGLGAIGLVAAGAWWLRQRRLGKR